MEWLYFPKSLPLTTFHPSHGPAIGLSGDHFLRDNRCSASQSTWASYLASVCNLLYFFLFVFSVLEFSFSSKYAWPKISMLFFPVLKSSVPHCLLWESPLSLTLVLILEILTPFRDPWFLILACLS